MECVNAAKVFNEIIYFITIKQYISRSDWQWPAVPRLQLWGLLLSDRHRGHSRGRHRHPDSVLCLHRGPNEREFNTITLKTYQNED